MSEQHSLDESTKVSLQKAAAMREINHKEHSAEASKLEELKRDGNPNVKKSELAEIKGHKLEIKTKSLHDEMEPQIRKAANLREIQKTPSAQANKDFETLKREGNQFINKKEIQSLAKTENITVTTVADEE